MACEPTDGVSTAQTDSTPWSTYLAREHDGRRTASKRLLDASTSDLHGIDHIGCHGLVAIAAAKTKLLFANIVAPRIVMTNVSDLITRQRQDMLSLTTLDDGPGTGIAR